MVFLSIKYKRIYPFEARAGYLFFAFNIFLLFLFVMDYIKTLIFNFKYNNIISVHIIFCSKPNNVIQPFLLFNSKKLKVLFINEFKLC